MTAARAGPDIFEAVEEQLGLKLAPKLASIRAEGKVLVVDRMERPLAN